MPGQHSVLWRLAHAAELPLELWAVLRDIRSSLSEVMARYFGDNEAIKFALAANLPYLKGRFRLYATELETRENRRVAPKTMLNRASVSSLLKARTVLLPIHLRHVNCHIDRRYPGLWFSAEPYIDDYGPKSALM